MKVHVLMACYNRKELTVQSIRRAARSAKESDVAVSFTLFDDGSTDGTSEAVAGLPFAVNILKGDGNAYWARSMAIGEKAILDAALTDQKDIILWLNDDVILDDSAFSRLKSCVESHRDSVIVGAVRDPRSGHVTYSGMQRSGIHPLRFSTISPIEDALAIDTFNGNFVAVPVEIARRVGGIDGEYAHGLADIDYGLRCNRLGISVLLAPGTFGTCPRNEPPKKVRVLEDWRRFTDKKGGGHFSSLRRIVSKEHPFSWPFFIGGTYGLWWARRILRGTLRW